MKVSRILEKHSRPASHRLKAENVKAASISGDNREIMRHSNGSIHAAIIEQISGVDRLSLFGSTDSSGRLNKIAGPIGNKQSQSEEGPATDSNQNGVYVGFVGTGPGGKAGYVAHFSDLFGDPEHYEVHGPLTPFGQIENAFLQCSRGYNSVACAWCDKTTGEVYLSVSEDGRSFPQAQVLASGGSVTNGPATGIFGDLIIAVWETTDEKYAPEGRPSRGGNFLVYRESGDCGKSWTEMAPVIKDAASLPFATEYALRGSDLQKVDLPLTGTSVAKNSLQCLMWMARESNDRRIFVLSSTQVANPTGSDEAIGLLSWKRQEVGGSWNYVVTNKSLLRQGSSLARTGDDFRYCALPGTSVRVIAYVEKSTGSTDAEQQISLLVSTNMGNSFDFESTFRASELNLAADADIVVTNSACTHIDENGDLWQDLLIGDSKRPESVHHALLPVGINVQGMDPTMAW